ncbi:MAG: redoxin family protein [Armatimonadetes bacterium]|nr:redoxin family protein [Armatimonadota bacterium]
MRIRTALAILSAAAISSFAAAQSSLPPALHVGDDAPKLPIIGVVKGNHTPDSLTGKTTVVEFWATWCGPCIASMPHLSDLADHYKGKVDFYSVNTWDYNGKTPGEKEEVESHKTRVNDWVTKNTAKMRYNIVLDDQKDTISTSWMFAAGRYGIPCAFIINDEGKIAWVGHPMQMEKPLEEISAHTWDIKAFMATANPEIDKAREDRQVQLNISAAVKANDKATLDSIINESKTKDNTISMVISMSSRSNPTLALDYVKQYFGKEGETGTPQWAQTFMMLAMSVKEDADKAALAKFSETNANAAKPATAALIYTYHARVLNSTGDKAAAMVWIDKAKAAVDTFEPSNQKDAIKTFIDSTAKSFKS